MSERVTSCHSPRLLSRLSAAVGDQRSVGEKALQMAELIVAQQLQQTE